MEVKLTPQIIETTFEDFDYITLLSMRQYMSEVIKKKIDLEEKHLEKLQKEKVNV